MNQFKKIKKNCNKVLLTNEELDAPISNEEGIENSKINVSNNHHVLAIIQENEIKPEESENMQGNTRNIKNMHFKKKFDLKRKFHHLEQIELEKMQEKTIYNEDELNALKVLNQAQNNSAKELINELHESNNNFIEIEANTRIENNEEDNLSQTIALKNEESDSDEFNREQVELAKKTRENQRRISSGDYIPLQNRDKDFFEKSEKERIYMSGVKKEEDRIKKEFLEEEKTQKKKKFQSHFAEDEEDDEFQRYEKKLINKVIKKKNVIQNVIANQDQLLDDQKGKFNNSTQFIPIKKQQFNFENISYDYINSFLEENCKTIEKNIESTKQKIEKLEESHSAAEIFLSTVETQIQQKTSCFLTSQNNLEFWTEYSDMITEKLDEIQNAKAKLQEIKTQYLKKKNSEKMEDLNAWFLQTDGNGIPEFSQQDSSDKINLHSEKIDLKMKLLSQTKKIARSQKICDLNYDSDSDSERKANENYQEMIKAKSEFFEAVDGILLEIEDEFKNIRVILRKISELQKKLTLDDNKIKNWIVESLKIFVETDLLKFDPFGQSESSFAYHHICDLFKLKNFETFKEVREELDDKMKIIFDKVIEDFWENLVLDKMVEVIDQEWNIFSKDESEILKKLLLDYIENVYSKDSLRLQKNLTKIQTILTTIVEKIHRELKFCNLPNKINSLCGSYQINKNLKLMKNLMEFTNFLPISNIITIVFEMLVNEIFFAKIQDLDIQTKVLVSQKIFNLCEENILQHEKSKKWVMLFSYFLNVTLSEIENQNNEAFFEQKQIIIGILMEMDRINKK